MKQDANSIAHSKGVVHLRDALDVSGAATKQKQAAKGTIFAAPYAWRDPSTIPPRDWLYARHYIREFVTATIAPGGMGKSSLAFAEAVAMCTGRNLLGHPVREKLRVWVWNGEDPAVELERRVAAICLHFGIDHSELAGRLFLNSGRDMPIRLAAMVKGDVKIDQAQIDGIRDECKKRNIDVLIIDPWVSAHRLPESANTEIDALIKDGLSAIAEQAKISIDIVHHVRKPSTGQTEVTADDARGASALVSAVRSARVLNLLTPNQATSANITEEDRRRHFRVDFGKTSMVPANSTSKWHRLASVALGNATRNMPEDHVGVVTPWTLPDAFSDVQVDDIRKVQAEIAKGEWAENIQASNWAGVVIGTVMQFDSRTGPGKAKAKALLAAWVKSGALRIEMVHDSRNGRARPMVIAGAAV